MKLELPYRAEWYGLLTGINAVPQTYRRKVESPV